MSTYIYCEVCEGRSEYVEYYEERKDGIKIKVVECVDCETVYKV